MTVSTDGRNRAVDIMRIAASFFVLICHIPFPDPAALYTKAAARFADAVSIVARMSSPLCMFILGVRLAQMSFRSVFSRPFVYLTTVLKLVVFPLFCWIILHFLPLDPVFKASVLVLASVPNAAIMLSLAELHHGETELAANTLLVTTLLCFLTMPVLASFLI